MSHFRAINEDESSESDTEEILTEEAAEGRARGLYSEGLQLLLANKEVDAEYRFREVLLEILPSCSSNLDSVQYGTLTNLGKLYGKRGEHDAAFRMFVNALTLDDEDPMLWHRIGREAEELKEYLKAGTAYKEVLSRSPRHWPTIDRYIPILLHLGNPAAATDLIDYALELDSTYQLGLEFRELLKDDPLHPGPIPRPPPLPEDYDHSPSHTVVFPIPGEWTWQAVLEIVIDICESEVNTWIDCQVDLSAAVEMLTSFMNPDQGSPTISQVETPVPSVTPLDGASDNPPARQPEPSDQDLTEVLEVDSENTSLDQQCLASTSNSRIPRELLQLESWGFVKRRSTRAGPVPASGNVSGPNSASTPANTSVSISRVHHDILRRYLPKDLDEVIENLQNGDEKRVLDVGGPAIPSVTNHEGGLRSNAAAAVDALTGKEVRKTPKFPSVVEQSKDILTFFNLFRYVLKKVRLDSLLPNLLSKLSWMDDLPWPRGLTKAYLRGYYRLRRMTPQQWYALLPANKEFLAENVQMTLVNSELALDLCRSVQKGDRDKEELENVIGPHLQEERDQMFQMESEAMNTILLSLGLDEEIAKEREDEEQEMLEPCSSTKRAKLEMPSQSNPSESKQEPTDSQETWRFPKPWKHWMLQTRLRIFAWRVGMGVVQNMQGEVMNMLGKTKSFLEEHPELSECSGRYLENECFVDYGVVQREFQSLRQFESIDHVRELYKNGNYAEVVSVLSDVLLRNPGTTPNSLTDDRPHKPILLKLLLDSLFLSGQYVLLLRTSVDIFRDLLRSRDRHCDPNTRSGIDRAISFALETIDLALKEAPILFSRLSIDELGALANELIRITVVNMEAIDFRSEPPFATVEPWILISEILASKETYDDVNEEKSPPLQPAGLNDSVDEEETTEIPSSIRILCDAHEWLGKRGMCSTSGGRLLRYFIEKVPQELVQKHHDLQLAFEQAVYCLYGHPQSKKGKGRSLEDHGAKEQPLTWERASYVFAYFRPAEIPDFDSNRLPSITVEVEGLFRRILQQLPTASDPVQDLQPLLDFIEGRSIVPPTRRPPTPSRNSDEDPQSTVWILTDIYYFLADHYMKRKEFGKAGKFYEMDIVMNPKRFDSWGGLATAKMGALESKLNSCLPIKQDGEMFKKTDEALVCFRRTLELEPRFTKVWIEFGSLAYTMHSYASRELKQECSVKECEGMSMFERISELEERKKSLLLASKEGFLKAKEIVDRDSRGEEDDGWLIHFMLGKIKEKLHYSLEEYLNHYLKASCLLEESGASYPKRIQYSDPSVLSLESLEVYYRTHAAILKYVLAHMDEKISMRNVECIKLILWKQSCSSFARGTRDNRATWVVRDIMWDIVQSAEEEIMMKEERSDATLAFWDEENCSKGDGGGGSTSSGGPQAASKDRFCYGSDLRGILKACLNAIKLCVIRFPQHYKSSHLLAKFYHSASPPFGNIVHCRDLLLGKSIGSTADLPAPSMVSRSPAYQSDSAPESPNCAALYGGDEDDRVFPLVHVSGLFKERKKFNFFNGIWRIPSTDVDRPGSFASHMRCCIALLIEVLHELKDFSGLMTLSIALHSKPEPDKMYLFENERKVHSESAFDRGLLILQAKARRAGGNTKALLLEVYRSYIRVEKAFHGKKSAKLAALLAELYAKLEEQGTQSLDEALRYCQRHVEVNKNPGVGRKKTLTATVINKMSAPRVFSQEVSSSQDKQGAVTSGPPLPKILEEPPLKRSYDSTIVRGLNLAPSRGRGRPRKNSPIRFPFAHAPVFPIPPIQRTGRPSMSVAPILPYSATPVRWSLQKEKTDVYIGEPDPLAIRSINPKEAKSLVRQADEGQCIDLVSPPSSSRGGRRKREMSPQAFSSPEVIESFSSAPPKKKILVIAPPIEEDEEVIDLTRGHVFPKDVVTRLEGRGVHISPVSRDAVRLGGGRRGVDISPVTRTESSFESFLRSERVQYVNLEDAADDVIELSD